MDLHEIVKDMKNHPLKFIVNQQENIIINRVKLFSEENSKIRPDLLYIIKYSLLSNLNIDGNFVCIMDCKEPVESINMSRSNLITVNEKETPESLYEELESILADGRQFEIYSKKLLNLLSENKGIEEIFEAAYQLSGNPISLETIQGEILYYTKSEKLDDILKNEMLIAEKENLDNWFLSEQPELKKNRLTERINNSKSPVYYIPTTGYPFITFRVIVDQKIAAYVSMFESEHNFTRIDYKLTLLLGDIVSYEMQKWNYSHNLKGILVSTLIQDILDQNISDPLIIEDRMRAAKLELKEYNYVLVISVDKHEQANTMLQYIIKRIMEILKENKAVVYKNSIVMIITRNKDNPFQKDDLKDLSAYLKENRLNIGISSHFEHFRELYKYYHHALKYLKIGLHLHKEKSIYSYEEYGLYQIMDICSGTDDILNFCHRAMFDLSIYDKRNGTNFAHTLYVFLKNMQSQVETSNELKIYRSTLVRHINLIKEITNLDLNDENLSFHLQLTYKILVYIGYADTKSEITN